MNQWWIANEEINDLLSIRGHYTLYIKIALGLWKAHTQIRCIAAAQSVMLLKVFVAESRDAEVFNEVAMWVIF